MVGGGQSEDELLNMVGLFPRSNAFYILLGMVSADVKIKTAAFLKCIQLDKESSISIDILASLYLKQKNYLAAAKLFLKSLELDILNPKCYLGLAICLFCLISRAI
jgi:tetratricopeptide (TPR) repeat protein